MTVTRNLALNRRAFLSLCGVSPVLWRSSPAAADAAPGDPTQRGTLRIGTSGDYAPFSGPSPDGPVGLDLELTRRLARDLGLQPEYVPFAWKDLSELVDRGAFDLAASGVTVRAERALVGRFTRPYASTGAVALVKRDTRGRYSNLAALDREGVRIVVNGGGHLERVARIVFSRATIETIAHNLELPERVLDGGADAAISDSAEAHAWRRPGLSSVGPFTRDRKAMLVRSDLPELARSIDAWLGDRETDGFLPSLRKKWLGAAAGARLEADTAVAADIELRCSLMPLVSAAKRGAGLPIEDPAQEARVLARVRAVATEAGVDPEGVARLYVSLMAAAKAIQAASGDTKGAAALERLRRAIGGIDEHLIRQLSAMTRRRVPSAWRHLLAPSGAEDPLTSALAAPIADALSGISLPTRTQAQAAPRAP